MARTGTAAYRSAIAGVSGASRPASCATTIFCLSPPTERETPAWAGGARSLPPGAAYQRSAPTRHFVVGQRAVVGSAPTDEFAGDAEADPTTPPALKPAVPVAREVGRGWSSVCPRRPTIGAENRQIRLTIAATFSAPRAVLGERGALYFAQRVAPAVAAARRGQRLDGGGRFQSVAHRPS